MVKSADGTRYSRSGYKGNNRFWEPSKHLPCNQPPWGRLFAINVNTGDIAWQVPLGITESLPEGKQNTGRPNLGGSMATASGLVFIGATDDSRFRAFDSKTGKELWVTKLVREHISLRSLSGQNGKQYVVVTATGENFPEIRAVRIAS
jgi:quinoprotein glucose dehydrogenase